MKKLPVIIGLASGAIGATLSIIDVTASEPFPYEFETFLRAPPSLPLSLLSVLGIGAEGDVVLWDFLEIASNTLLFVLGGLTLLLLLHLCRIKWRDWTKEPDIAAARKLALLAAAWGIATIASLASGYVKSVRDFVEAAWWFPVANGFVGLHPLVGWLLYLSITTAAAFACKRRWYFVLYAVLSTLLIFNVIGCHRLPPPGSSLM